MQTADTEWLLRWKVSFGCTSDKFWELLDSWAKGMDFLLSNWELDAVTLSLVGSPPLPTYLFHVGQESSEFGPRTHVEVYLNYRLPSDDQETARVYWELFFSNMESLS